MTQVKTNFGRKIFIYVCVCENGKFYNLIFGGNVHLKRPNMKIGFMGINVVQLDKSYRQPKLKTIKTNLVFGKVEEMRSKSTD